MELGLDKLGEKIYFISNIVLLMVCNLNIDKHIESFEIIVQMQRVLCYQKKSDLNLAIYRK